VGFWQAGLLGEARAAAFSLRAEVMGLSFSLSLALSLSPSLSLSPAEVYLLRERPVCCRGNSAQARQTRLDYGSDLGHLKANVLETFQGGSFSRGSVHQERVVVVTS